MNGNELMSARLLLEVALRVLGVWFILTAVHAMTTTASIYLTAGLGPAGVDSRRWLVASGISVVVQSAIGLGLIWFAPRLAAQVYGGQADTSESPARVGPGDLYHIACFVLGAFLFVSAAEPAGRMVNAGLQGRSFGMAGDAFTMVVYMGAGIFLVFGSRRIGELLSSLRYDPESIANQQFSIKLLLILTGIVAALLGFVRWLALKNG